MDAEGAAPLSLKPMRTSRVAEAVNEFVVSLGRGLQARRIFGSRRGRAVTDRDLAWLAQRRPAVTPAREDAAATVSHIRDEWER